MEALLKVLSLFSWLLWVLYCYFLLLGKRKVRWPGFLTFSLLIFLILAVYLQSEFLKKAAALGVIIGTIIYLWQFLRRRTETIPKSAASPVRSNPRSKRFKSAMPMFLGLVLSSISLLLLFYYLTWPFQEQQYYFIKEYQYGLRGRPVSMSIGNDAKKSDLTILNNQSDDEHVRLRFFSDNFSIRNLSKQKRVDIDGHYLNEYDLKTGQALNVTGMGKVEVGEIGKPFPLGRSFTYNYKGKKKTVHLLFDRFSGVKLLKNEPAHFFVRQRPRWSQIFLLHLLLCLILFFIAIVLHLRNKLRGFWLIFLLASIPFLAGYWHILYLIGLLFLLFLNVYGERGSVSMPSSRWFLWSALALLVCLFINSQIFGRGSIIIVAPAAARNSEITVNEAGKSFSLDGIERSLAYDKPHRLVLGFTKYQLLVKKNELLSLGPEQDEKLSIPKDAHTIVSLAQQIEPEQQYVRLPFPHIFNAQIQFHIGEKTIYGTEKQNAVVLTCKGSNYLETFRLVLIGLLAGFVLFGFVGAWSGLISTSQRVFYLQVFFLIILGFIVNGTLGLYSNRFSSGFKQLAWGTFGFLILLGFFLIMRRHNRIVPLIFVDGLRKPWLFLAFTGSVGLLLLAWLSSSMVIWAMAIVFFVFSLLLFGRFIYLRWESRKDQQVDFFNWVSKDLGAVRGRFMFWAGRKMLKWGWNRHLFADVLLFFSLLLILAQAFSGREVGIAVMGTFLQPIELAKILLAVYFADWVYRTYFQSSSPLKVPFLWIYILVILPFAILIVGVNDFSPLLVFGFVFIFHKLLRAELNNKGLSWKKRLWTTTLVLALLFFVVRGLQIYNAAIIIGSLAIAGILIAWQRFARQRHRFKPFFRRGMALLFIALLLLSFLFASKATIAIPQKLGDRVNAWILPWENSGLSEQYINSLWYMKGAGVFGRGAEAFLQAEKVPLIEKDLTLAIYVRAFGIIGFVLLVLTLGLLFRLVLARRRGLGSAEVGRKVWDILCLEFLTVIFMAQFLVQALYLFGLLPLMGQSIPFLSAGTNMMLLFAWPFSVLVLNCLEDRS